MHLPRYPGMVYQQMLQLGLTVRSNSMRLYDYRADGIEHGIYSKAQTV